MARLSPATAASAGITDSVIISTDRGAITCPVEITADMIDGVVWVPMLAPGIGLNEHLAATAGDVVTLAPGAVSAAEDTQTQNEGSMA